MRPPWPSLACACALLASSSVRPAQAQTSDAPLAGKTFNLDLITGPVLGSGRIVGLGGAYTALSTGIEGVSWNPAAYAARVPWDTEWFEWDLTFGLTPETIRNSDFDNNGEPGFTYDNFMFVTGGLGLKFAAFGVGALINLQSYDIGSGYDLSLQVINFGAGYALFGGQLVLGVSARAAQLTVTERASSENVVEVLGLGPEVGALWRASKLPLRLGVAARTPVESGDSDMLVVAGRMLPRQIRMPWEVQIGAAYQLGPRPLNPPWTNPRDVQRALHTRLVEQREARLREQYAREQLDAQLSLAQQRVPPTLAGQQSGGARRTRAGEPSDPEFWRRERELRTQEKAALIEELERLEDERAAAIRAMPRRYLLLSVETLFEGPTENGVGVESFLSQIEQVSGDHTTIGVRAGIEGEPIEHWLQMRAGTYLEPSRFEGVPYRVHGTCGFDLRLFTWDLFALLNEFTLSAGAYADVAERYLNLGISVGLWH